MIYVYSSLGASLGDKEHNLCLAVREIEEWVGEAISLSTFYATAPWGFSSEHTFLSAAARVRTLLPPLSILHPTQEIEHEMGRTHKSVGRVYSDRVTDINLLLYDSQVLDIPKLKLPHPLMHERRFVLEPLAEIVPDLVRPVLKEKMLELL